MKSPDVFGRSSARRPARAPQLPRRHGAWTLGNAVPSITRRLFALTLVLSASALSGLTIAAEPLRVALIAPLSGEQASEGRSDFAQAQFVAGDINRAGGLLDGRRLQVVGYDTRGILEETPLQVRRAIGEGVNVFLHGGSSEQLAQIATLIESHNATTPNNRLLLLDYATEALPPSARCSAWRFRFDASPEMKIRALGKVIGAAGPGRSVFLLAEDTAFGNALSLALIRYLGPRGEKLTIAGNALYSPESAEGIAALVSKISDSRVAVLILASRGTEILSLANAKALLQLRIPVYTFFGAFGGVTKSIGLSGVGLIRVVHVAPSNPSEVPAWADLRKRFKALHPEFDFAKPTLHTALTMFVRASEVAKSPESARVAAALARMRYKTAWGDEVEMRAVDQQLLTPVRVSVHANKGIEFDVDNSGFGLRTEATVSLEESTTEPGCTVASR